MQPHDYSGEETGQNAETGSLNAVHPENSEHSQDRPEATRNGRKLKVLAGVVAVALMIGFFIVHRLKSAEEKDLIDVTSRMASNPPIVNVISVQNAPRSAPLTLPGETAAWYESIIYARVDGYVAKWHADIGDHVRKGQVLATIETPDLEAQLVAARAKLKAAEASVVARQADADFAETTYARWKNSPRGVVSEQEREAKKADYESSIAHLNEAKAQVALDRANVDRYAALTQFKQVRAPYDGTIVERRIDIGNLVTAGSTANTTPLYRMAQDDPIRVFVDVPQSAAENIKVGVPAQISASNIPDRVFKGKVARIAGAINPQSRTLRAEVDIPNPDHALVSGMYVNVTFQVLTGGLVQVPPAALVFRSSGPQIAIIDKGNRVTFRKVTIARDDGPTVAIDSGISLGDKIALNISSQITEGETVEPHEFTDGVTHTPAQKK
jgi:RND family efflux transporter MFP subunit